MAGVGVGALLVVAMAVLIGAMTQTSVGLGLGLVSAPFMTIATPSLMPGALIMLAATLPFFTLVREHRDIDWFGLGWAMPWRVVGTVAGVWIITQVTTSNLERIVGVVVLLGVLLTARAVVVPINRGTLGVAGFVSGVTGTATSIGGPPFALLYQHRPPHQIRSTIAVFFTVGAILSLIGLGIAGELTRDEVEAAAVLVPVLAIGVLAGTRLRSRLPLSVMRPALLLISGASAVVLVVRSFF
ncbi:TSUP family transporter [Aeromicrobium sp. CF3.5]|uniref:TSUP family transporter n=1 Tax=Aeromicrobium sp. CF3.5 TaxID=3373078 RepID=UPI003EE69D94